MDASPTPYAEFGIRFVRHAVTTARVRGAIMRVVGDRLDVGPLPAGPAGVATATAVGRIEDVVVVVESEAEPVRFAADVRVAVDLGVALGGTAHAYRCDVTVRLRLAVRTGEPLRLLIEVDEVGTGDVSVRVAACGLRARVLQRIGGVDRELRRGVRNAVRDLLHSPRAADLRTIELLPLIDAAWPAG